MSNLVPQSGVEELRAQALGNPAIDAYPARSSELGSLKIRRALPVRGRRMVGPWCFFDRYGPLSFDSRQAKPMDVAPHPHIGLQTVSWLLEGEIVHHDSLGYESLLRPGELNLMTAGRGIAHAEETPEENSGKLNGVQLWVALPKSRRFAPPSFEHRLALPVMELSGGSATVVMGQFGGQRSPASAHSPMVGADLAVHAGERLLLPLEKTFEHALMILDGEAELEGQRLEPDTLYYIGSNRDQMELHSRGGARAMLIGGAPFEETVLLWWNFVARSSQELAAARDAWQRHELFGDVKAYRGPRLDAPEFSGRPIPSRPG